MSTGNVAEIQSAGDASENQAAEDAENQAGNIAAARLTAFSSYGRRRDSSLRSIEMQSTDVGDVANKLLKRKREIPSTGKEEELDLGIIHSLFSDSRLFIGELQNQLERDRDCFLGLLRKSNEECENRFRDESAKLDELLLKYKASHVQALDDPFSKENERLKEQYEESRQAEESLILSIAGKIDQIKEALEKRDQDENVLAKLVVESANLCPGLGLMLPMQDDSKVTN